MADALDSKSSGRKAVWVQVPPPVLLTVKGLVVCRTLSPIRTETHHWEEIGKVVAFVWPLRLSADARRT